MFLFSSSGDTKSQRICSCSPGWLSDRNGYISVLVAFIAHPGFKYCTALKLSLALTVGKTNGGAAEECINLDSFKNSILDLTLPMKVACGTSQCIYSHILKFMVSEQ